MTDTHGTGGPHRASDEEIMAAVPRATGGREARVGLFVLVGLVSFVIVLFWMTDPATLRGRYILVTSVEHAGGVRAGDPVQMQGVNVGRVHGFDMVGPGRVDITLEIEGEWSIPEGSRTVMGEAGLFGGRTIEIITGSSATYLEEGDTLPGEGASGAGLLGSVDELSGQAGNVLERLESLLSRETVGSVQGSARELEQLLTDLSAVTREQRHAIDELMESLTRSAAGFEDAAAAGPDVARAAARADSAMALLAETSQNLDAATLSLRTVLGRMESGEGTLGRLSTDETLYVNLNTAAESLAALIQDLQANPNRYINISIF
jgi:phospholipid/cholesterol/gamma-HCH transport system substrate-binding protein